MSVHPDETRLADFAEGLLSPSAADEVERHLSICDACAEEAERTRTLRALMAELPAEVAPSRDLYPEVAAHLWVDYSDSPANRSGRQSISKRRAFRRLRYPLLAAAVALVVLSTAIDRTVIGRKVFPSGSSPPAQAGGPSLVSNVSSSVEADLLVAIGELETQLAAVRRRLDPETLVLIDRNLELLDAAIAETRSAATADPRNATLRRLVLTRYQQKLDLLRGAAGIPGEI